MRVVFILVVCCTRFSFSFSQEWNLREVDTGRGEKYLSEAEKDVILLVNKVRTMPALFAKTYLESHKGESVAALECYEELLEWSPRQALSPSKALSMASRDHARDMGSSGKTGHVSTNGKSATDRVKRYGVFTGAYTGPWENCSYGFNDPLEIILQLLVDDDVPSRGHRKNIMEVHANFMGTAIQPHKEYDFNCVMDFADSIKDK